MVFKPFVVWQDDKATSESNDARQFTSPEDEAEQDIIGGSAIQQTTSALEVMAVIAPWIESLLAYLRRKELPEDQTDTRQIIRQSKAYKVHEGELYKQSAMGVLQRCISKEKEGCF